MNNTVKEQQRLLVGRACQLGYALYVNKKESFPFQVANLVIGVPGFNMLIDHKRRLVHFWFVRERTWEEYAAEVTLREVTQ